MPNNSALPVETLDAIVQELITALPEGTEDDIFLPRRQHQLAPLLHVSKLWHAVTERHMYRVISIGKRFPCMMEDEAMMRRADKAYGIAKKLVVTLTAYPRLAAYVETLELVSMSGGAVSYERKWAHMKTCIVQACPNVKHISFLGAYDFRRDPEARKLTSVLKEKSLLSFCYCTYPPLNELNLSDILSSWPNLQTLHVKGCRPYNLSSREPILCCPELHEITLLDCDLRGQHYDFLCSITNHVTKLYVSSNIGESRDREAFYRCLRTWSSTLTHLRIRFDFRERNHIEGIDYKPLWDVVSTMTELRELQIYAESYLSYYSPLTLELNLSLIGGLSKLEQLCIVPRWEFKWPDIAALRTAMHLPALRHIVCWYTAYRLGFCRDMRRICDERNIKLEEWIEKWKNSKIPGFVL